MEVVFIAEITYQLSFNQTRFDSNLFQVKTVKLSPDKMINNKVSGG